MKLLNSDVTFRKLFGYWYIIDIIRLHNNERSLYVAYYTQYSITSVSYFSSVLALSLNSNLIENYRTQLLLRNWKPPLKSNLQPTPAPSFVKDISHSYMSAAWIVSWTSWVLLQNTSRWFPTHHPLIHPPSSFTPRDQMIDRGYNQ